MSRPFASAVSGRGQVWLVSQVSVLGWLAVLCAISPPLLVSFPSLLFREGRNQSLSSSPVFSACPQPQVSLLCVSLSIHRSSPCSSLRFCLALSLCQPGVSSWTSLPSSCPLCPKMVCSNDLTSARRSQTSVGFRLRLRKERTMGSTCGLPLTVLQRYCSRSGLRMRPSEVAWIRKGGQNLFLCASGCVPSLPLGTAFVSTFLSHLGPQS